MNSWPRRFFIGMLVVLMAGAGIGHAQPAEVRTALPTAVLAGSSRLTFLGFSVYEAKLWVAPGFKASEYPQHAFALELLYQRDFTNEAISQRSIDEMQRQPDFPRAQLNSWQQALRGAFPDVRKGDRITGIHRPGEGAVFVTNGQTTGTIPDDDFARLFFGIWLSARTSEPKMRSELLADTESR